jgi:hypothetical protein
MDDKEMEDKLAKLPEKLRKELLDDLMTFGVCAYNELENGEYERVDPITIPIDMIEE